VELLTIILHIFLVVIISFKILVMVMRLNEEDITHLILACQSYKNLTGSEFIWDQYDQLTKKLKIYLEQYSTKDD